MLGKMEAQGKSEMVIQQQLHTVDTVWDLAHVSQKTTANAST